jgi:hypothetical protein
MKERTLPIAWDMMVDDQKCSKTELAPIWVWILSIILSLAPNVRVRGRHSACLRKPQIRLGIQQPPSHPSLMLRPGLFVFTKPLFRPVASRSGPHILPLRPFGSATRSRILELLPKRPTNFIPKPFQQSSRSLVDSAVISRPSQGEAWRRYAITAVRQLTTARVLASFSYSPVRRPQSRALSLV